MANKHIRSVLARAAKGKPPGPATTFKYRQKASDPPGDGVPAATTYQLENEASFQLENGEPFELE